MPAIDSAGVDFVYEAHRPCLESSQMIGIFSSSIPGHEFLSPEAMIDEAQRLGLQGLMFGNVLSTCPDLSPDRLKDLAAHAETRGVRLAAGAGIYNPARPERNPALIAVGNGDPTRGMARLLRAMPTLGVRKLFFVVGMIEDRDDPAIDWQKQLEGVVRGVQALAPAIRESGVRLLVKTHEEISSFEILRLLEAVGPDLLGVAHDPVNVACRVEDAVECTRRLAPHIEQLHVDDALLTFEEFRMRRYLTEIGTGDIDWPAILALLPPDTDLWAELHRGQFSMPVLDGAWLAEQKDATLDEYRSLVAASLRRMVAADPIPDQADPFSRIPSLVEWLRARRPG